MSTSGVLEEVRALTVNPPTDKATRHELYSALQKLSIAIEDPYDTMYRILHSPKILAVARIAVDLKIFQRLVGTDSLTVSALSEKTGCDATLMGRILRFLSSHDMISEVGEDTFAASRITKTLAIEGFEGGMQHGVTNDSKWDFVVPCLTKLDEFLKRTNYRNPDNPIDAPFNMAFGFKDPAWVFALSKPDLLAAFSRWMATWKGEQGTWLDVYDFAAHCQGTNDNSVIFVDVGGSIGHQCALLRSKLPDVKGRTILQDQAMVLEHAIKAPGIEPQAVDMWKGQDVKGAKAYYMRAILHDFPDARCVELLKITAEAMTDDSILLIDEIVIPNTGAHPRATDVDIEMMITLAAIERTEKQWRALFGAAGFKVLSMKRYVEGTGEAIIAVVPSRK